MSATPLEANTLALNDLRALFVALRDAARENAEALNDLRAPLRDAARENAEAETARADRMAKKATSRSGG